MSINTMHSVKAWICIDTVPRRVEDVDDDPRSEPDGVQTVVARLDLGDGIGRSVAYMNPEYLSRETVQVVLQAPRESWDNMVASDFSAHIDLTGLEPGIHDVT